MTQDKQKIILIILLVLLLIGCNNTYDTIGYACNTDCINNITQCGDYNYNIGKFINKRPYQPELLALNETC